MENFRRKQNAKQRPSTDGFISSSRLPKGHVAFDRGRTLPPTKSQQRIGNFQRTDGFFPAKPRTDAPVAKPARPGRHQGEAGQPASAARSRRAGAQQPQEKKKHHVLRKSFSTLAIVFLLAGGYMFGKGYLSLLQVFRGGGGAAALQENVDPASLRGEGDGRVNILLLGRGGEGHAGANLTDTIIVASIDPINKKAALLSIPRDLWVRPHEYGAMKINSVFAAGQDQASQGQDADEAGITLLEETLEDTIGIPVHYHVMVDFEGFKQAIDTVGGVTIDVPEELAVYEYYPESGYELDVGTGLEQFDGTRALAFARTRKTSPRGDFDRSERQRLTMLALKDKVFSIGTFGNPLRINELLSNLGSHISSNLSTEEVLRLYEIAGEIGNSEIASVGLADEPNSLVHTANIDGLSVVVPKEGTFVYDKIQHYVRNALRDGFLSNEDATVAVYNGTDIGGLAGRTADELESFGYNVSAVADAPSKGMVETVLVDLTNGEKKYTRSYLQQRFGVTAVSSMPDAGIDPGTADFVIILGTNEETRLDN